MSTALIKKLPEAVVRAIAAGEVVEKPASILKELLENSIDAGATNVTVRIEQGGLDLVEVADNGKGIALVDLPLATQLHATSKLSDISDLENISSFGFRGEALASIAAAAEVIITSNADGNAYVWSEDSDEATAQRASRDRGTTIAARNLFRKLPARRKFLRTVKAETLACRDMLRRFACTHPEVAFRYYEDGELVFDLGIGSRITRIVNIFKVPANELISVESADKTVTGVVGLTSQASKRPTQIVWVNNRLVKNSMINAAVKRGFGNNIPPELNPFFLIWVNLPGSELDVNIHPRKEEVKFADDSTVFKAVQGTVASVLQAELQKRFSARFNAWQQPSAQPTLETNSAERESSTRSYSSYSLPRASSVSSERLSQPVRAYEYEPVSQPLPILASAMDSIPAITNQPTPQILGQIFETYILAVSGDELIWIDQHAADERIHYEQALAKLTSGGWLDSVPYLVPLEINIPENADLEAYQKLLSTLGLSPKITDTGRAELHSIPSLLQGKDLRKFCQELEAELRDESDIGNSAVLQRACATIACHSSIRAGQLLNSTEQATLIQQLWQCDSPHSCPHGRPITWVTSRSEAEVKFMRKK